MAAKIDVSSSLDARVACGENVTKAMLRFLKLSLVCAHRKHPVLRVIAFKFIQRTFR